MKSKWYLIFLHFTGHFIANIGETKSREIVKKIGENITFKCPSNYNIRWAKEPRGSEWPTIQEVKNQSLQLNNLTKEHAGYYHCFSNDVYTEMFELKIYLTPYFTKAKYMESNHGIFKGDMVGLPCTAEGYPHPDISWFKNNLKYKNKWEKFELLLVGAEELDRGNYSCTVSNSMGNISFNYHVNVFDRYPTKTYTDKGFFKNISTYVNGTVTLSCSERWEYNFLSNPFGGILQVKWYRLFKNVTEITPDIIKLNGIPLLNNLKPYETPRVYEINNVNQSHEGWYICVVEDRDHIYGHITFLRYLNVENQSNLTQSDHSLKLSVILPTVFVVILVFAVVILYGYLKNKMRQEREDITTYFTKKIIVEKNSEDELVIKIKKRLRKNKSNSLTEFELSPDPDWEISREHLFLGKHLGSGTFGKVIQAEMVLNASTSEGKMTVAIKMLKDNYGDKDMIDLVYEMETMKRIEKHPNIINFIGCSTQGGHLYIIMEYACYGNLLDLFKKHKSQIDDDRIFTEQRLISFADQVAKGMKYLSLKKYVHRDLAARNILVGNNYTLKIADFGLTRNIEFTYYYKNQTNGLLPVKWMAPESINKRIYTTKSDVWSYGILLYEIMTLGETPYPLKSSEELIKLLKNNKSEYCMEIPLGCPQTIYAIMHKCWNYDPNERPTFSQLVDEWKVLLDNHD